jgi:hypothetical protein
MIKEFVSLWFEHKDELQKIISETKLDKLNYKSIVVLVIENIVNKGKLKLKVDNLTEIDHGGHSGTLIYIVPRDTYQPDLRDYYFTENHYGSCSSCDIIINIQRNYEKKPKENLVSMVMVLCLHVIQRLKKLEKLPELHYLSEDKREEYIELCNKLAREENKFYEGYEKEI